MMIWTLADGAEPEWLGFIPSFVSDEDPDDAKTQLHKNYQHGGGWRRFDGFTFDPKAEPPTLNYPGDKPLTVVGETTLRGERILVFQFGFVVVVSPDGKSWEVARMD